MEHPNRPGKTRPKQFSWELMKDLARQVLGDRAQQVTEGELQYCCDNVKAHMFAAVKAEITSEFSLAPTQAWGKVPADAKYKALLRMEALAAPFLPLRACVGNWGAYLILAKFWTNADSNSKQKRTTVAIKVNQKTVDCVKNIPPNNNTSAKRACIRCIW